MACFLINKQPTKAQRAGIDSLSNEGSSNYLVDQVNTSNTDFIIYVKEGDIIKFDATITVTSNHPFLLSTEVDDRDDSAQIGINEGWDKDTLTLNFKGSAGQSFGAFSAKGLKLVVEGNTNDYFGKGLSGATIVVKIPKESTFESDKNIITGNVTLYGATSGEAYINGIAGERFCVRNSGATAVVEGVGDHGCEYMTGGVALVLGKIGRNFAAGMSGGIAYILNEDLNKNHFNYEMIELETPDNQDIDLIKSLVEKHFSNTSSQIAEKIIKN